MEMIKNILVFEDDKFEDLLPLVYVRPVYDLICGMSPILAKIVRNFPESNINLHCRSYLKKLVKQNHAGISVNMINTGAGHLLVNGRLVADKHLTSLLVLDGRDRLFLSKDDEVIAAYLNSDNLYILREMMDDVFNSKKMIAAFRHKTLVEKVEGVRLIEYPWDLIALNSANLVEDFEASVPAGIIKGDIDSQVSLLEEYKIFVGEGTTILPGVVLNAQSGPIYIGEGCQILPGTYIEGPAFIGNSAKVAGATISAGSSIGPCSSIYGNVRNSIICGYSYVGKANIISSYLGELVDITDGVIFSDRKPFFHNEPDFYINGRAKDVDISALGSFVGDYSFIGEKSLVPYGAVLGLGAILDHGNYRAPKVLPSFLIQDIENQYGQMELKDFLDLVDIRLSAKEIELTQAERDVIREVYEEIADNYEAGQVIY